ncbi:MAG: L,D-transpeptidase [Rhizobium sp.]|nr:L,D-transpeptidase [Rhizobium sp.]
MIAIAAAAFATLMLAAPAQAGFLFKDNEKKVEVAGLSDQVGWLAVLSDDKPAKAKKKTINTSPIARKLVKFDAGIAVGTIVIDNSERRLYHVISKGVAMRYGIAIGKEGFGWTGTEVVTAKQEWPTWTPPEEMRIREARKGNILPVKMDGGIDNPLGARAMYLGSTQFRIHGTNKPNSIGTAASSGCFRMANEDVEHLYAHVKVGARVIVRD